MTAEPVVVRPARVTDHDVGAIVRFLVDHMTESGNGGTPHFALHRAVDPTDVFSGAVDRWSRGLDEPLWGRAWAAWAGERVVGNVELRGGKLPSEMHRATLGMGVARAFAGRGIGRRLVDVAVSWARENERLAWIDLGVFSENVPALALYRRAGFVEQGVRPDAHRIDAGVAVTDVLMALDVR